MATSLTASTLKVVLSERFTINGTNHGGTNTTTITGIKNTFKRIVTVSPLRESELYDTHASNVDGSTFDSDLVKYARITNKDTANAVDLIIKNTANDEVGVNLAAGASYILQSHATALEANAGAVTITTGVAASQNLVVADGDAANGMTEGQYFQLIDASGTTKNYVLSDTADGGVATGTVLSSSSDLGDLNFSAVTAISAGVAVGYNKASANQYTVLAELKTAIEHANGHNGSIICTSLPGAAADGAQLFTMTNLVYGTVGNTVTTTDISNLTSADFSNGVDGIVTNKVAVSSINAIANVAPTDVEIFIASA